MNLMFHIFKKDLRRLWPLICAFLAYVGLITALLVQHRLELNPGGQFDLPLEGFGLAILALGIVVLLIHEDRPGGTSGFWLTRPIPPMSLMAAKGVFILLFLFVVPSAAHLFVLLQYGLSGNDLILALAPTLSTYLAFLGVATVLAALTSDFKTYLLAWAAAWLFFAPFAAHFLRIDLPMGVPIWITQVVLPNTSTVAVCLLVLAHQYRTRRTKRSAALLIAGLLLTLPSSPWFPSVHQRPEESAFSTQSEGITPWSHSRNTDPWRLRNRPWRAASSSSAIPSSAEWSAMRPFPRP